MPEPMIINIVNFIRGVEPRLEMDLLTPVLEQLRLVRQYDFPATWLLQYDALRDAQYVNLLRDFDDKHDIGVWFEVVQQQAERVGIPWRGRYSWDWESHVDFPIGYTPAEREKLADVLMAQFKETFGYYPKSVGSWVLDAHTLGYLSDRYGITAACNCKDQWGTDGYTLWGGYFNQAYYPSRLNAFVPAQHVEQQIPVPIFRMLGSDPIYQYDDSLGENGQGVITLEPVQERGGGGSPEWTRWFFDSMIAGPNLSFGYAQVGQENSFGWPSMAKGLTYQCQLLDELRSTGKVRVETLAESGAWFRRRYPLTPASAVTALTDWQHGGRRTVWYGSNRYRANLLWEDDRFYIRDIHLFEETYAERYLTEVCPGKDCTYDTLPILDGFLWSDAVTRAGIYPVTSDLQPLLGSEPMVEPINKDSMLVVWPLKSGAQLHIALYPDLMIFAASLMDWALYFKWAPEKQPDLHIVDAHTLAYTHEGYGYQLATAKGRFSQLELGILLQPEEGLIMLIWSPDWQLTFKRTK